MLHDVPEDRLAADLDHRLGLHVRLFGEPRAQSAGKNHNFHELNSARTSQRLNQRESAPEGPSSYRDAVIPSTSVPFLTDVNSADTLAT